MNKMDADYISQHDIAKRYLQGKLTPEETVEFEEYIMDKPELLEQLELDSVMVEHLPLAKTSATQEHEERNGLQPSFWQVIFGTPVRASFATFAFCVILGSLLFNVLQSHQSRLGISSTQIIYLENYRSSSTKPPEISLKLDNETQLLVLVISPDVISDNYVVKILDSQNGKMIAHRTSQLSKEGEVNVAINSDLLDRKRYFIELSPLSHPNRKIRFELVVEM